MTWINTKTIFNFLQHFPKQVKPTKEDVILLLLDNHASQFSTDDINSRKDSGIVPHFFPPYILQKLQPFDKGMFGPLKKAANTAVGPWTL